MALCSSSSSSGDLGKVTRVGLFSFVGGWFCRVSSEGGVGLLAN